MRTFDSVIGHREIIEHLQNAVRMGKVSHAYLISGEEGSGKKLLAGIFAAALQLSLIHILIRRRLKLRNHTEKKGMPALLL